MKKNNAFTLIEVMMSLMILASCVTILGSSQIQALMRSFKSQEEISHIYPLRKTLYDRHKKMPAPDEPVKIRVEEPEMSVVMSAPKINKKSSLFPLQELVKPLMLEAEWETARGSFSMKLLKFSMQVPPTKEKNDETS